MRSVPAAEPCASANAADPSRTLVPIGAPVLIGAAIRAVRRNAAPAVLAAHLAALRDHAERTGDPAARLVADWLARHLAIGAEDGATVAGVAVDAEPGSAHSSGEAGHE